MIPHSPAHHLYWKTVRVNGNHDSKHDDIRQNQTSFISNSCNSFHFQTRGSWRRLLLFYLSQCTVRRPVIHSMATLDTYVIIYSPQNVWATVRRWPSKNHTPPVMRQNSSRRTISVYLSSFQLFQTSPYNQHLPTTLPAPYQLQLQSLHIYKHTPIVSRPCRRLAVLRVSSSREREGYSDG